MEEEGARRVQLTHLLPLGAGEAEELLQESGFAQGDLAVVLVQVEGAALVAGVGTALAVVNGDGDAVALEDAGAGQAAGTGADDGDAGGGGRGGRLHGGAPFVRVGSAAVRGGCQLAEATGVFAGVSAGAGGPAFLSGTSMTKSAAMKARAQTVAAVRKMWPVPSVTAVR